MQKKKKKEATMTFCPSLRSLARPLWNGYWHIEFVVVVVLYVAVRQIDGEGRERLARSSEGAMHCMLQQPGLGLGSASWMINNAAQIWIKRNNSSSSKSSLAGKWIVQNIERRFRNVSL